MICDKITVNTQSSIRIDEGITVYFDPLEIAGEPHDADIILITHEHYDHYSPDDIAKISRPDTVVVAPVSMNLSGAFGMKPGDTAEISGLKVEAVPAYNKGKLFHRKSNSWLGYVIELIGERIYVCGDTDATDEAKSVRCDVILVPIGGTYTMNAREAAGLVNVIRPKCAIPIHYGGIVGRKEDAVKFRKLVDTSVDVIEKLFLF